MSRALLVGFLALLGSASSQVGYAQPTVVAENKQPYNYQNRSPSNHFTFALPGKRYLQCGTYEKPSSLQYYGLMLAITKQNGDTVRYMTPIVQRNCASCAVFAIGVAQNPDYTFVVSSRYLANPPVFLQDSLVLLCVDTLGTVRWRRAYRPANISTGTTSQLLRVSDGYLLGTNRFAFPGIASTLTPNVSKFDLQGRLVWERAMPSRGYGGVGYFGDLIVCPDGSYLALGHADDGTPYTPGTSAAGRLDYYAVRFRPNGDTLRTFRFGLPGTDEVGTRLRATPDGGYAAIGYRLRNGTRPPAPSDGQVFKLDSLFRPQWRQTLAYTANTNTDWLYKLLQPLASGDILCGGSHLVAPTPAQNNLTTAGQLAYYSATGAPVWDFQRRYQNWSRTEFTAMVNHADGAALLAGSTANRVGNTNIYQYSAYSAYLTNVGVPYVPDLCTRPPRADFGPLLSPGRDSLRCLEFSAPGPRYGVLTAWHWAFPDGTTYDGQTPPVRRFAPVPPAGAAVTLTVTNNLGCTHTTTQYPWGPLSAAQQLQALQAGATLYPNPATDRVTLAVPQWPGTQAVPVQVLDALGRVVAAATARPVGGTLTATLDLAGLPTGVYAVRVLAPQGSLTRRLVRE